MAAKAKTQEKQGKSLGAMADVSEERKELLTMDLNSLLMMEADALGLYDEVISYFEEDEDRSDQIERFREDHERHVEDLTELVETLGGTPLETEEPSPFGELAVQHFTEKAEDDGIALLLYKVAEHATKDRYEALLEEPLPDEVREVVQRCADDEDKHYEWAKEQVEEMEVPGREE